MLKSIVLGIAILPGGVSIGITAVTAITAVAVVSAKSAISAISTVVSAKTGLQFRVDDRLRDGHWHVIDDRDGVGLGYLDSVWGGNWDLDWNFDRNGDGAVYWDRNMLGDLNWVRFRHLDGIRAIDGHGVWHLEEKESDVLHR